ncbi:MAG: hypothetical protein COU68_00205, partial [Candidatus Pacebacteria bacterium CG10_big_fil_rev_8_21_14_0_10_45_6]
LSLWQEALSKLQNQAGDPQISVHHPWAAQMAAFRVMSKTEERAVFATFQEGRLMVNTHNSQNILTTQKINKVTSGKWAYHLIVNSNLRLVVANAKRFLKHGLGNRDELDSAAYQGLEQAIEKFDLSKKTAFSTYAVPWIRKYCFEYFYNLGLSISIPPGVMSAYYQTLRVSPEESDPRPSVGGRHKGDLPSKLMGDVAQQLYAVGLREPISQYGSPFSEMGSIPPSYEDQIADQAASLFNQLPSMSATECQTWFNIVLTPQETQALTLRYGLSPKRMGEQLSYDKIGKICGISKESARTSVLT